MKSVRLFDFIQFDGSSWQVAAHDGAELALKNLSTGRIRRVPVAELLSDDSYLPEAPAPLPSLKGVALLETLEPGARAQAELLHRHVYEIVNGTPPDAAPGTAPKPEYDLANPLRHHIEAKAAELAATGTPIAARTMRRHVAAYRKHGIAGLADGRNTRQSTLAGWADPELVALLEAGWACGADKLRLFKPGRTSRSAQPNTKWRLPRPRSPCPRWPCDRSQPHRPPVPLSGPQINHA